MSHLIAYLAGHAFLQSSKYLGAKLLLKIPVKIISKPDKDKFPEETKSRQERCDLK